APPERTRAYPPPTPHPHPRPPPPPRRSGRSRPSDIPSAPLATYGQRADFGLLGTRQEALPARGRDAHPRTGQLPGRPASPSQTVRPYPGGRVWPDKAAGRPRGDAAGRFMPQDHQRPRPPDPSGVPLGGERGTGPRVGPAGPGHGRAPPARPLRRPRE